MASSSPLLLQRAEPYQCTLSEPILAQAQAELLEVPENRQVKIKRLRKWLSKQPHIRSRDDDRFLLNFLRARKFRVKRAGKKLEYHHEMMTHCPELMCGGDPTDAQLAEVLRAGLFVPMPKPLPNGQRLVIIRVGARDPERVSAELMIRVSNMIMLMLAEEDEACQVAGVVGLLDLKDATWEHSESILSLPLHKTTVTSWESFPVRLKGMHCINTALTKWYEEVAIDFQHESIMRNFTYFMNEKMKKRLWFHGSDRDSLHAAIPPECLPEEYGGTLGSIDDLVKDLVKRMEENRDFFLDYKQYGVDEKRRRGGPKSTFFRLDGSFMKL